MDEFIIWDDGIHTFAEAMEDKAPSGGFVPYDYIIKCDGYLKGALNGEYPSFKNIGLKDINGKSIYADSSIVEYGIQKWKVIYNVFQMSYELECVSNKSLSNMRLTGAYQNQLKIIDTIQENKLGLIKNDS